MCVLISLIFSPACVKTSLRVDAAHRGEGSPLRASWLGIQWDWIETTESQGIEGTQTVYSHCGSPAMYVQAAKTVSGQQPLVGLQPRAAWVLPPAPQHLPPLEAPAAPPFSPAQHRWLLLPAFSLLRLSSPLLCWHCFFCSPLPTPSTGRKSVGGSLWWLENTQPVTSRCMCFLSTPRLGRHLHDCSPQLFSKRPAAHGYASKLNIYTVEDIIIRWGENPGHKFPFSLHCSFGACVLLALRTALSTGG